jgi:uncharacterized damage-inducible protein DinB
MAQFPPLSSMLAAMRESQPVLLDLLNQVDDHVLYQRLQDNEWTMAETLVHVAEARDFFVAETREVLAKPDATIGRTISHPGRLQNILDHGQDARASIAQYLLTSYAGVMQLLQQLSDRDLQQTVTHVKFGPQPLGEFINHFIVEHDQAHIQQIQALPGA